MKKDRCRKRYSTMTAKSKNFASNAYGGKERLKAGEDWGIRFIDKA